MSKPSILIVPGSFALPEFYDEVVTPMAAKGYAIKAIHLPSVGLKTGPREGEPPTMYDDAAFIAKEVTKLADEGKDVVLIAHSYGGAPTTESTKGLGKAERQKAGKKGGIVRLAYLTALVPDVGQPAGAILAEVRKENRTDPIEVCHSSPPFRLSILFYSIVTNATDIERWMALLSRSRKGCISLLL